MKTSFIILIALVGLVSVQAQQIFRKPTEASYQEGSSLSVPDSVKKRTVPWLPRMPHTSASPVKKPVPPIGTLKISTEIPSILFYDGDSAADMAIYNHVSIYKVQPGLHTLVFQNSQMTYRKTITVDTGTTGYYKLRKDTTLSDSVIQGNVKMKKGKLLTNQYIPFKHALSFELVPGLIFNGRGIGFNTRFVVGFTFERRLGVGIGIGYTTMTTHFKRTVYDWFTPIGAYESDNVKVSFIPVFVNVQVNFPGTRSSAFLSLDMGVSVPVSREISTRASYYGTRYYLKIDRISNGFYGSIAVGYKYFLSPFLEIGGILGSFSYWNDCYGHYYMDPDFREFNNYHDCLHVTTGFNLSLLLAFHLDTKKLNTKRSYR